METKNLDIYGNESIPWDRVLKLLEKPASTLTHWLSTTRPDGRPHLAGVGAVWAEGRFYVVSGAGTRKSLNLAQNPQCAIAVSLPGIDLVVEGTAAKVTDPDTLERMAQRYRDSGWPAEVKAGAFVAPYSAPSAGPPPWDLHEVMPVTAFGVASEEPHGATRWRFSSASGS